MSESIVIDNVTYILTPLTQNASLASSDDGDAPLSSYGANVDIEDLVILGVFSQVFIFIGILVALLTGATEYHPSRDIFFLLCILVTITTYLCGKYVNEAFDFDGWAYLFIITICGVAYVGILQHRNEVNKASANLNIMTLAFSMLMCVTTRLNTNSPHCTGPVFLGVIVCMVPLRNALVLLKSSIASFDSRMRSARMRLIVFVLVWATRIMLIGAGRTCGGFVSTRTYVFQCISIDMFLTALACEALW